MQSPLERSASSSRGVTIFMVALGIVSLVSSGMFQKGIAWIRQQTAGAGGRGGADSSGNVTTKLPDGTTVIRSPSGGTFSIGPGATNPANEK